MWPLPWRTAIFSNKLTRYLSRWQLFHSYVWKTCRGQWDIAGHMTTTQHILMQYMQIFLFRRGWKTKVLFCCTLCIFCHLFARYTNWILHLNTKFTIIISLSSNKAYLSHFTLYLLLTISRTFWKLLWNNMLRTFTKHFVNNLMGTLGNILKTLTYSLDFPL